MDNGMDSGEGFVVNGELSIVNGEWSLATLGCFSKHFTLYGVVKKIKPSCFKKTLDLKL